jgi:hypothetical protein
MFVARDLAMIGLAQFLFGKEKRSRRVDQRRRGEFARSEAGMPGEEPLLEIRTVVKTEAAEGDGEFGIAESEGESELAVSNRDCCAGRVLRKESAGRQVGEIAPPSTE